MLFVYVLCITMFFLLTAVQNYKNQARFSRVMAANVLPRFNESQNHSVLGQRGSR